jgi:hypothetical protein
LIPGGERPERTAKIDGERYTLLAVGLWADLKPQADKINLSQWKGLEKPSLVVDSCGVWNWNQSDVDAAKAASKDFWFSQYHYQWSETDGGAPARLKTATADQLAKWTELQGWQNQARGSVYLLWQIVTMPEAPTELRVGRDGKPLTNQTPTGEQI